jgi:hypothetical protein
MNGMTGGSEQIIGRQRSRCGVLLYLSAAQLWRAAAVIVCSFAALTAGVAEAVPVSLAGSIEFTTTTNCSPWCGSSEAKANIIGAEGWRANGQFQGGGAAATSAILGGGGFFGKTAAATASFEWWAWVYPVPGTSSDPFHLFFDWDATLFASHDALLGQAAGGIEVEVTWYGCLPFFSDFCFPMQTFQQKRVFTGSVFAGEQWDLGLFNQSDPYGRLHVTFDVGSIAATTPWFGVYASAIDIGTFDFTLRADDGRAQPVPEPPILAMMLAALMLMMAIGLKGRQ